MRRHAWLEALESRKLLSGNVTVTADTTLTATLTGDNKPNEIAITLLSNNQGYLLTGLRGTTLNGLPAVSIPTTSAFNFNIDMGNGNDSVVFFGTSLGAQNINLATGNGRDKVVIDGPTIFGNLTIASGNGRDRISVVNAHITGNLTIGGGNGNDSVIVAPTTKVDGTSNISGGKGHNSMFKEENEDAEHNTSLSLLAFFVEHRHKHKHHEDD
jgi:hypothetical protein